MKVPETKEIPEFDSEDHEREFWAAHDSTDYFDWAQAGRPPLPSLKREPPSQRPTSNEEMSLLSGREQEVLQLLAEGASKRQISEVLSISPATVYTHVRHIRAKLRIDRYALPSLPKQTSGKRPTPSEQMSILSVRELDVLELLAQGATNKQISEVLSISPNTVYTHVRHIQGKLRTANRTQTASLARTMSGRS